MKARILALDDDSLVLDAFRMALRDSNFALDVVETADECLRLIKQNPLRYAVVFIDHNLSSSPEPIQGDVVARKIKEINNYITIVMVSGDTSQEALASWLAAGVDQFLYKPFEAHQLKLLAEVNCSKYEAKFVQLTKESESESFDEANSVLRRMGMISVSPAMNRIAQMVQTFAKNDYNVLLLGETGTGKEVLAQSIHSLSAASKRPFLPINCSAYKNSDSLLESELFGHERGAFTGADKVKIGLFESAQGGTVFLDEVHHLGPNAQAKLLRVIQERKIRKLGSNQEIAVKFRLLVAGKPNLKELTIGGSFLPDLYYRIKELQIDIPALRNRPEDIKPLVFHFKSQFEHETNRKLEILESTIDLLRTYPWPGNIRELSNVMKELVVRVPGPLIRPDDLPMEIKGFENDQFETFKHLIADQEMQQKTLIMRSLEATDFNVKQTAERLGLARTTLRDLMKKYQIQETRTSSKN